MSDYLVKLAQNQKEIESAQRLRFEVFNIDMKKGLESSFKTGLDCDEYDSLCDHILIIDKTKNRTIGTYRLLLRSRLGEEGRFYCEQEFDIENIKKLKGEILEMGRSCVHKDYRSNSILHLLWAGIIEYFKKNGVRYVIGCPSLYTLDPAEISEIFTLIKRKYLAPEIFRVSPKEGKAVVPLNDQAMALEGKENRILLKLPSLVRSYFKVGALVCGEPAVDREFGTVDLLMLLEVAHMSASYLRRFRIK